MDDSMKTFGKWFGAVCLTVAVLANAHFYVENKNLSAITAGFDLPVKHQAYAGAKDIIEKFNPGPDNVIAKRAAASCIDKGQTVDVGKNADGIFIVCHGHSFGS